MTDRIGVVAALLAFSPIAGCGPADRGEGPAPPDTAAHALETAGPAPAPPPSSAAGAPASVAASPPAERVAEPQPQSTALPEPQDEAESWLRRAAARYAEVRSMRAAFAMETQNPLLRETVRSRGDLFQRRPDRILLRFAEPAGDIIVSDGRAIWIWYPSVDSTQVLRGPAATGAGGMDLLAQFVGDPTLRFASTLRGSESVDGRPAVVIALDPRGEEPYRQLVVWIDRRDHLVRRFEITELSGVVRRVELHDLVIDPALPDSLFRFSPPPGARIVGAP
jgi:outer membrane lipoprotein carrier protein